jgi:hypothetical protein
MSERDIGWEILEGIREIKAYKAAAWILEELVSERRWEKAFAKSEDVLARLAEEALVVYQTDQTQELDPDQL